MFRAVKQKLNKWCSLLACLHFVLSFFTDRLIFTYRLSDFSSASQAAKSLLAIGSKIAFFFVLLFLWHGLFYFVKKADRNFVKYTLMYLALMSVLLLLTYPGIFRMDEFGILFEAQNIFPVFWQNYITSVFYIFALMLFPFPAGVVLTQSICISLIVGYLIAKLKKEGIVRGRWVYGLYLPFLLFPVLDSNLYPMRMSLYAFLELLFLTQMALLGIRKIPVSSRKNFPLALLAALLICWRSEAIYYLIAIPVCFVVLLYRKTDKEIKFRFILYTVVISFALMVPQKLGDKLLNGNQYDLTSVVLPAAPLISACRGEADTAADPDRKAELEQSLAILDQVVNVDLIVKGYAQGRTGISMFWSESDFQRSYSDKQFAQFKREYYKLILRYPDVFIGERWETFLQSEELLENTTVIFDGTGVPNHERFASLFANRPLNQELRKKVISVLELRSFVDYNVKLPGYHMLYHAMIPLCLMLVLLVVLLIKRKWGYALLLASHLCKVPLIFLTAPSRLFMYYYPVYLVGAFVATTLALAVISRRNVRRSAGKK